MPRCLHMIKVFTFYLIKFQICYVSDIKYKKIKPLFHYYRLVIHSMQIKRHKKPWVLFKADGEIETAHCTCMAGLGEACSHVASLLFYVDAFQRTKEATTCTQEQCKLLLPKAVKEVPYLPVAEIDFKGAIRKMQDFNFGSKSREKSHGPVKKKKMENACCTGQDKKQKEFLNNISLCGTRPAILSIAEPFNEGFVPFGAISNLYLPELYSPSNTGCSFDVIQRKCVEVVLPVLSEEQLQRIQRETAKQSTSKLWFRLRSGRITAS